MRTLVTGGTGFTGSCLVRRLLSLGHEVVVLDNQRGLACDELEAKGAQVHIGMAIDQLQRQRREACPEALRDEALRRLRAALGDEATRN